MTWNEFLTLLCTNGIWCSGGGNAGDDGVYSVPELSITGGPIALAIIVALIAIGLERRRRTHATEK